MITQPLYFISHQDNKPACAMQQKYAKHKIIDKIAPTFSTLKQLKLIRLTFLHHTHVLFFHYHLFTFSFLHSCYLYTVSHIINMADVFNH